MNRPRHNASIDVIDSVLSRAEQRARIELARMFDDRPFEIVHVDIRPFWPHMDGRVSQWTFEFQAVAS